MKIVWLTNIMLPAIAKELGLGVNPKEGWLTGLYNDIEKRDEIELLIIFPQNHSAECISGNVGRHRFVGFPELKNRKKNFARLEKLFETEIEKNRPGLVHIFGTENMHSCAMVQACKGKVKTIIHIQGLISVILGHVMDNLPLSLKYTISPISLLKRNFIVYGMLSFAKRSVYEKMAIRDADYITGRTDWDYACCKQIKPDCKYVFCNESLRDCFYEEQWKYENCEKNTIFVSQSDITIKGVHQFIKAMAILTKTVPDAQGKIIGTNKIKNELSRKEFSKLDQYQKYISKLITKYHLEKNITFLGFLNAEEMKEQYLKANIFVCPSSIENSPNSLGEAMLLGVPCITADIGGVKNMLVHEKEGIVYQGNAAYMLAYYLELLLNNPEVAVNYGRNAAKHAAVTHNRETNSSKIINLYNDIVKNNL